MRGAFGDRREPNATKQSVVDHHAARMPRIASLDSSGPEIASLRYAISSSQ
ncbi:MAG: hypothetical protein ACHQNE_06305 [Candidatus Kapaibacterium sp.]